MKWFLFRQGMYTPTMLKHCIEFMKSCQECQLHAGIQHVPASELHLIIKPWPFRGWALGVIGEIKPGSSKGHKYILVGIHYFTKWVEAIPLRKVTQDVVISFIQNHILHRFGILETITTDQGSVFTGQKTVRFANQTGFKLFTSTPYYAQANGQVEAADKNLITLIKKKLEKIQEVGTRPLIKLYGPIVLPLESQLKQLPLGLHLDMMLYYLQKFVFNRLEFKDNMKFLLTIIGIWFWTSWSI